MTILSHLTHLNNRIAAYEQKYQRSPGSVRLLAVSKNQSIENILAAFQAGQTCFGESYLQEALPKMAALTHLPIEWHFIGPLQSNKTKKIAEHFAWVHSVDTLRIAQRLHEQRPVHLPPLNICLQVNMSAESSKSGISVSELLPLATACLALPRLNLRGLMTIPALETDFKKQRAAFHQLSVAWQTLRAQGFPLDTLSMGMSADFEAAIAEGSTLVRIGSAVFSSR
ncbi:MAG TPA: YggS family pyridoxal phosphate-dependent enzyme [Gammaproteobacteria bacterium]|jgi:hypothetical protein|nr:YggS family pyridoxal phosphate-dependent enzyme [Gammaproteobacteria bacterium]